MPIYEYWCTRCSVFEIIYPMGTAPDVAPCPACSTPSVRKFSAPNLSHAGSAAAKLIDSTVRSASEPQIIKSHLPPGGRTGIQRYTSNPLHQKLPRP